MTRRLKALDIQRLGSTPDSFSHAAGIRIPRNPDLKFPRKISHLDTSKNLARSAAI